MENSSITPCLECCHLSLCENQTSIPRIRSRNRVQFLAENCKFFCEKRKSGQEISTIIYCVLDASLNRKHIFVYLHTLCWQLPELHSWQISDSKENDVYSMQPITLTTDNHTRKKLGLFWDPDLWSIIAYQDLCTICVTISPSFYFTSMPLITKILE